MSVNLNATFLKQPTPDTPGVLGVRVLPLPNPTSTVKTTEVAFLIDTSTSMDGERLDSVKQTLKVIVQMLKPGDKISLVSFAQTATNVLSHFTLTDTSETTLAPALDAIDSLRANGGTNLGIGISLLGDLYKNLNMPDAIVVLTDGHINEGTTTFIGLNTFLETYFKCVPTYTLGYGTDHNAELLKQIAEKSCANYTFIKSELSLPITLGDMYGGLRSEVAKKAVLNYPETWTCCQILCKSKTTFELGSLIANKPMWAMFTVPYGMETTITLSYMANGTLHTVTAQIDTSLPLSSVEEQNLSCMTAKTLVDAANFMKNRKLADAEAALKDAIKMIDESSVATTAFVVDMKAQLSETLEQTQQAISNPSRMNYGAMSDLYYRTTSLGGNFVSQRGRTQMVGGATPMLFSSQEQGEASVAMTDYYTNGGGSATPACDPVPQSPHNSM